MESVGIKLGVEADFSQLTSGVNNARQSFINAGQSIESANRSLSSFIASGSGMKFDAFADAQSQRNGTNPFDSTSYNSYSYNSDYKEIENVVEIKNNTSELIKELQNINKGLKDSNALPQNTESGSSSSDSIDIGGGSKLSGGLSKLLKGGLLATVIKGAADLYVNAAEIRNAERSRFVGMAQGDVGAAEMAAHQKEFLENRRSISIGTAAATVGFGAAGAMIGSAVPILGTLIGGAIGTLIGYAANKINEADKAEKDSKTQEMLAMSGIYKNSLPMYEQASSVFFSRHGDSGNVRNYKNMLGFYEAAKGTGLSIDEFGNFAIQLGAQGIGLDKSNAMTRNAALWARFTGGDTGQFNSYLGLVGRYGKENANSLNFAYGASRAGGLERAQFGEFLQGLESVISSGISKGFVRSTEDVSKTLATLSILSGGSQFWSGEQGAERLNSINSGIAGATSLGSTTQILAYQAFKNGGFASGLDAFTAIEGQDALNTFAAMERGINGKSLKALTQTFDNAFGNDVMSNVMALKEISGLNFTGAMQLYNMTHGKNLTETELDAKIKAMKEDPNFKSDKQIQQDLSNTLQNLSETLGQGKFDEELDILSGYTEEIRNEVKKLAAAKDAGYSDLNDYNNAIDQEIEKNGYKSELGSSYGELRSEAAKRIAKKNSYKIPYLDEMAEDIIPESGLKADREREVVKGRLRDTIIDIFESYQDEDPNNDRDISLVADSETITKFFIDIKGLLEKVVKNTNEVTVE